MNQEDGSHFYLTGGEDQAIVGCCCGQIGCDGTLILKRSDDPDDEHFEFIELQWDTRGWGWKQRWRLIWDVVCGRTLSVCASWNRPTATAFGRWLLQEPVWRKRPRFEDLTKGFKAITAWYEAGRPQIPDEFLDQAISGGIIASPPGEPCPECEGDGIARGEDGRKSESRLICLNCKGTGRVEPEPSQPTILTAEEIERLR